VNAICLGFSEKPLHYEMLFHKNVLIALVLAVCALLPFPAIAQTPSPKYKAGMADATKYSLSAEAKSLISRSDNLIEGEQQGDLRREGPEWRLGYSFQAWFIMMVQYRSLKKSLRPDEADACTNCMSIFGQKFRKAQKELGLDDDQLLQALGKNPNLPEMYAEYWPAPAK